MRKGQALWICVAAAAALVTAGCAADDPGLPEIARAEGIDIAVVIDDLQGPTQLSVAPDGSYLLAQLAGTENEGSGQVVQIDPDSGAQIVLFDGLDKPTGVAVRGDEVWVMESDQLSRGPRSGGELTLVAEDLPNNGRSEGTLTITPDGDVLYNTSGRKRGANVVPDSGRLWTVGDDGESVELASGFKNAYAHTFDADGVLWTTEIGDGRFDDLPPLDELVAVQPGIDHGWPVCVGDNRAVLELDGSDEICAASPRSHATFPAQATPTSVVVSPFDPDHLLVALWVTGEVVAVPRVASAEPHVPEVFLSGLNGPQHLVALDDQLLLVEFGANRILSVELG